MFVVTCFRLMVATIIDIYISTVAIAVRKYPVCIIIYIIL